MSPELFVIYNGTVLPANEPVLTVSCRAFRYGDGLFETIRVAKGRVCFMRRHLSRLTASMRMLKMDIPANFTEQFFTEQVSKAVHQNGCPRSARVRLSVFRNDGGLYMPATNEVSWLIEAYPLEEDDYAFPDTGLTVDIYQDYRKPLHRLSNIKSMNALLYVLGAEHARQQKIDDCVLINQLMNVVETTSSNLFAVKNGVLYTCPVNEGCVEGVMRSVIMEIAAEKRIAVYEVPMPMSVMFNSDEVFLTNAVKGVQWVASYKTKRYFNDTARKLQEYLNEKVEA
ncbi:MAG: branched-chain amino acid aminotransferase [Bacteroidetes bacterium]|nr:MAG: branched-chain amino acid aminotransferase [Bacteroidota bacterium]